MTGRGPGGLPEITFRRAATNMRVRNGQSIVIGGLINEFAERTEGKIPVLGDLPLAGKMFRRSETQQNKTETVIVITPRIMSDGGVPDGIQSPLLLQDVQTLRGNQAFPPLLPPQK